MRLVWLTIVVILGAAQALPWFRRARTLKDFALDEIIPNQFRQDLFGGTWITGTEFIQAYTDGSYARYNVVDDTERVVLEAKDLTKWPRPSVQFIKPNFDTVLIRHSLRTVFRHSSLSKYAVLNIGSGESYDIANGEEVSICILSPNGNSLAYVKDNNVYYRPNIMSNEEIPLTEDGVPGVIYNGVPDWVYEEEVFGTDATLWFSNDGTHLAMASFDDREVKEFSYYMYGNPGSEGYQYPEEIKIRYPKVNTTNPTVHLRVRDLTATNGIWRELPAPVDEVGDDHILGTVNWIGSDVGVIWTNRRQNFATFQRCNVETLECKEIVSIDEPRGWYDLYTPRCTSTGDRCFFLGENNGWRRIWEINDATHVTFESPEEFTVTGINGYDEVRNDLYYTAVPASAPHHRHVYRDGGCLTCNLLKDKLSNDVPCNYASVSFSTDFSYFVATCSGPTPTYVQIFRTEDLQLVTDWELNEELRLKLSGYKKTQVRFLKVPVSPTMEASVRLYLPPEIDFEYLQNNHEKYPMIVQVYGGPNSGRVIDTFTVGYPNYLTTTKKTIYCQIDGRGTANQGYDFMFTVNNWLGHLEITDTIAVTKYLQDTYSFIDRDHTGIWGWSYGGYVVSMTLEKDVGKVFKCGIAGAPVTSWMFYDSIYTERYMGLPVEKDNAEGYREGDVSQYVDGMKNHKFLLVHGTGDDNVHYQHSMVFTRALVDDNVMFEQMTYPDENHAAGGVQKHLYLTMDNFWNECFDVEE